MTNTPEKPVAELHQPHKRTNKCLDCGFIADFTATCNEARNLERYLKVQRELDALKGAIETIASYIPERKCNCDD